MSLIIEAAKSVQIVSHEEQPGDRTDRQMVIVEYPSGRVEKAALGYPEEVQRVISNRRWASRLLFPAAGVMGVMPAAEGISRVTDGLLRNDFPVFVFGLLETAAGTITAIILGTFTLESRKTLQLVQKAWDERLKEAIKFSQLPAFLQK